MNRKAKGTNAERELVHMMWAKGWSAARIAGSGSSKYPSPDVVAGNSARRLAIECKTCRENTKYLTKKEVDELKEFAHNFGAEPWIGVRFGKDWYFVSPDDAKHTEKGVVVSVELVKNKGLIIDELLGL